MGVKWNWIQVLDFLIKLLVFQRKQVYRYNYNNKKGKLSLYIPSSSKASLQFLG